MTWARPAPADEASPVEVHLRRAAAAIDLGNHADAAREYESAYMQSRDPALLVHVGQAWQRVGDRGKALTAFQSYLRVSPYGEHRAFCETKLRELEGQPAAPALAAPVLAPTVPLAPVPTPAPPALTAAPPPVAVVPVAPPPYPAAPALAPATAFAATQAPPAAAESPVYHRWPFWVVLGTVATGTALVLWYARDPNLNMPSTTFGTKQF